MGTLRPREGRSHPQATQPGNCRAGISPPESRPGVHTLKDTTHPCPHSGVAWRLGSVHPRDVDRRLRPSARGSRFTVASAPESNCWARGGGTRRSYRAGRLAQKEGSDPPRRRAPHPFSTASREPRGDGAPGKALRSLLGETAPPRRGLFYPPLWPESRRVQRRRKADPPNSGWEEKSVAPHRATRALTPSPP